jgi:hypothetical protein
MKHKQLILLLILNVFFMHSYAQKFEGGLQGGLNFCQVDGDRNGGYNMLNFNGGFFVHYVLPQEQHALGFDMMYMGKGSRSPRDENNINPILMYRYHYIELPMYYRYSQPKYAVRAGINWAYLISSSFDDGGSKKEIDGLRNTDILLHAGFEYHFDERYSIFASYQYSFRTIIDIDRSNVNVPFAQFRRNGVYHNLIQVSLKYYLAR